MTPRTTPAAPSTYICCGRTLNLSVAIPPRCRSCGGTMKRVDH